MVAISTPVRFFLFGQKLTLRARIAIGTSCEHEIRCKEKRKAPILNTMDRPSITLNLGAGAARGYAHIGVIKALLENKIPFDFIIGVSMGSLVGAVYSIEPDIQFVRERLLKMVDSEAFQESIIASYYKTMESQNMSFFQKLGSMYSKTGMLGRMFLSPGLLSEEEIDDVLDPILPHLDISHTRLPFACVAVELERGIPHLFQQGPIRALVRASMSMPVVFPPVEYEGMTLVDGGVLDKIGIIGAKKLRARKIIAVDVSNTEFPVSMVRSGVDVMLRTEEIASYHRRTLQLKEASVVIQPIDGNIHWADYSRCAELIDIGYEKTISMMDEIEESLKWSGRLKKFFTPRRGEP